MGQDGFESTEGRDARTDEETWLLGQPPLRDYLDFVRDAVVGGADMPPSAIVDEWRAANDYYHELEQREVGIADTVECRDLDPALAPLVEEVQSDPSFRRVFRTLPTSFGMVELDKLVVFQKSVTKPFVEELQSRLGPAPSAEALFRLALPLGRACAPVAMRRAGSRRYVFECASSDFRFHDAVLLTPGQTRDLCSFGPIAGALGIVVGFGASFLNAIRVGGRLVLHNGYHRACALKALGVTHAPCVIQTVTRIDELEIAAKASVSANPDFYFNTARPPLLKDFFDPKIRKVLRIRKQKRVVEVSFEVRDHLEYV
ncbi:hypothetical protein [Sorangium sp. So ce124]|uniref:hypothetical protein n=1 Tax=Sorangium sp. So ce124 TaxID=3133280 RepID=UPI003F63CFB1